MPRLIDQRTGRYLGTLTDIERTQLMTLLETTATDDEAPTLIDPDVLERLEAAGLSPRVLDVLQPWLEGREDFAVGWEPD